MLSTHLVRLLHGTLHKRGHVRPHGHAAFGRTWYGTGRSRWCRCRRATATPDSVAQRNEHQHHHHSDAVQLQLVLRAQLAQLPAVGDISRFAQRTQDAGVAFAARGVRCTQPAAWYKRLLDDSVRYRAATEADIRDRALVQLQTSCTGVQVVLVQARSHDASHDAVAAKCGLLAKRTHRCASGWVQTKGPDGPAGMALQAAGASVPKPISRPFSRP